MLKADFRYYKILPLIVFLFFFYSCSEPVKEEVKKAELNIGIPQQKNTLTISGDNLLSFINVKLLSDSSRNLINQLGEYKFSTSIDPENAEDSRYNPDVIIYYAYEGIELQYVGKGAGQINRKDLQVTLQDYSKYFYLDRIIIEPKLYKGDLPYGIKSNSKA